MAKAEVQRTLKRMEKFLDSEAARGAIDGQPQRVTMSLEPVAQSFLEGYNAVVNRRVKQNSEGYEPLILDIKFFRKAAKEALNAVHTHVMRSRTDARLISWDPGKRISFHQSRTIKTPFNTLKRVGKKEVNSALEDAGHDKLTQHRSERGKEASESSLMAQGTQRLHKTKRSVGALQLLAAAEWAQRSPTWEEFAAFEPLKRFVDRFGQIEASFKKGSYKGKNRVKFDPGIIVDIEVGPDSSNPAGALATDWSTLKPKLEKKMLAWAKTNGWSDQEASNSIATDARNHARWLAISALREKGLKVTSNVQPVNRKASTESIKSNSKIKGKDKQYRAKTKLQQAKNSSGRPEASLYTIMALINDKLPETVRKNMGAPRLENQTGRFAQSVQLTDVIQTPQGMPSFGYTYRKDPYSVYERTSGSSRADPDRDPRNLIDASIREIAAGYALGRFYTRRV
tara:strand:+ start:364 stop:1728 length:1365 start_codon:yes stop_codon:yes gene_type:complete